MKILIVDYGMGNLFSLYRAIEECGGKPCISNNPSHLEHADKIILPGVGSFKKGMHNLGKQGWVNALQDFVSNKQLPLLGICLGMQLLATKSYEHGETRGLNLISGEVVRLHTESIKERIPHVGWNTVYQKQTNCLFNNLDDRKDFYFVHSYYFKPTQEEHIMAETPYCGRFASAVSTDYVYGVQFHPEKSSKAGFQLLKNYICFS